MNEVSIMEWYNHNPIKFNLIIFLQNRELCLLKPKHVDKSNQMRAIRDLRCHSVQHITGILRYKLRCAYLKNDYNLFYSMATFKDGVPRSELVFPERDMSEWKKNCWKDIINYDMLIDIDADDHHDIYFAHKSALVIKNVFDKYSVPYELRFSGCGFHFIIPYIFLPQHLSFDPQDDDSIYNFCRDLAERISKTYSEMIDTTIYDSRRVCKIPYSVAIYETENYLCLPFLDDYGFNRFDLDKFKLDNFIISRMSIDSDLSNRGTHLFNPQGSIKSLCDVLGLKFE